MSDHPDVTPQNVTGFVLCGGQSTRFGSAKAHHRFEGFTLAERSIRLLEPFVRSVWLGIGDRTEDPWPGHRLVPDDHVGIGPLGGLRAGLSRIETDWMLTLPVDVPFLTSAGLETLLGSVQPGNEVVTACDEEGRRHPLIGLYHRSVSDAMQASISRQEFSVKTFLSSLKTVRYVTLPGDQLRNVNRPQDLF